MSMLNNNEIVTIRSILGILFWLNYKNTYKHWNEKRGAFTKPTSLRSIVHSQSSPVTINELNLMFQLDIVDLGIAIPLQTIDSISSDQYLTSSNNPDDTGAFLVFTLDQTKISACSCGAIISSGSFNGFCFRFDEHFQQAKSSWKPTRMTLLSPVTLDSCCVPSGQYSMHSLAKDLSNSTGPKWFLNVQWEMQGIDIHLSTSFGKYCSQLVRTITATQLIEPINKSQVQQRSSISSDTNSYQDENFTSKSDDFNEDVEKRKRLEYEYSILGQRIHSLK